MRYYFLFYAKRTHDTKLIFNASKLPHRKDIIKIQPSASRFLVKDNQKSTPTTNVIIEKRPLQELQKPIAQQFKHGDLAHQDNAKRQVNLQLHWDQQRLMHMLELHSGSLDKRLELQFKKIYLHGALYIHSQKKTRLALCTQSIVKTNAEWTGTFPFVGQMKSSE